MHGERPYSVIKFALAVLAVLILAARIIYFTGKHSQPDPVLIVRTSGKLERGL